jgi:GNAT superfamily N-acetyltransferase
MSVYKATYADFDTIYNLVWKFIENSPYKDMADEVKVEVVIEHALEKGVVFLDEDHQGVIGGIIIPFAYGFQLQAAELCWWVEPEARKTGLGKELLDAFENWASERDASFITMISLDDQVGKVYEKLGYALKERTYMKEIN